MSEQDQVHREAKIQGDDGNVVGNHEDKYSSQNPIARYLVDGFLSAVTELYSQVEATTVLEVGCGEGHVADHLVRHGPRPKRFLATDLELAQAAPNVDPLIEFEPASIYDLPYEDNAFELVICCEVLEHLAEPARGLAEVARVAQRAVLMSTPWEPMWRALNMARGKYWNDLGNTPGHIQHFHRRDLVRLAERELIVTTRRTPLPWTVLLGVPRP